jgi:replicative DNA helicase
MIADPFQAVGGAVGPQSAATTVLASAWPSPPVGRPDGPVATGLVDLDRISPLRPGRLTLLTGPVGVGVTSLLLGVTAAVAAGQGRPVVYVSDHLAAGELVGRLLAQIASVDLPDIPAGLNAVIEPSPHLTAAADRLAQLPIVLLDTREGCTTVDLVRRLDQLAQAAEPPALIVLDRASALTPPVHSGHALLPAHGTCLRQLLQGIADYACPVLAAERASRRDYPEPENTTPTTAVSLLWPDVEDLTDALWWLHRPEIHVRSTPTLGTGQLHVLWQRHGPTGYIRLGYQHHRARWTTLQPEGSVDPP